MGLMIQLEASLKYVPTYEIIDQIRQEEWAIAKDAVKSVQDKKKIERAKRSINNGTSRKAGLY